MSSRLSPWRKRALLVLFMPVMAELGAPRRNSVWTTTLRVAYASWK